ncbi:MAG: carbohydrate-binding family 9-like protein [Planctomycetaceae bacterium]|nr:carbohydrate-binding family 9-like protein [Planctomycetaceae bacterium]
MNVETLPLRGFLLATCFACLVPWAQAETPANERVFECRLASGPIKIDGKADELAWQQAPVIDEFVTGWAKGGPRAATSLTKARILWNDQGFYFLAEMADEDLYSDVTEHDGETWLNDVFEIFFKPADDKPAYYEFEINALNTQFDLYLPNRGAGNVRRFLKAHKFNLQTAVTLRGTLNNERDRDQGWTLEGLIPWTGLQLTGGAPSVGDRWRFTLCRYDYSVYLGDPELTSIALFKQANFHRVEDYPWVKFVGKSE